jgi:hypothetical protein
MAAPPDDLELRLRRVPDRHLLALRALACGFDTADLAALLGIPEGSVRPTLWLAAAKLVAVLGEADRGR